MKFSMKIDGVSVNATGVNVDKAMEMGLQLIEAYKTQSMDDQVRFEFLLRGKIPAIKLYRSLVKESGQSVPSLLLSKQYVEKVCVDLEQERRYRNDCVPNSELALVKSRLVDWSNRGRELEYENDRLKESNRILEQELQRYKDKEEEDDKPLTFCDDDDDDDDQDW